MVLMILMSRFTHAIHTHNPNTGCQGTHMLYTHSTHTILVLNVKVHTDNM